MGSLSDMIDFLDETANQLKETKKKTEKIQEYFNTNFNNVTKIRLAEITWLQEAFFNDSSRFPVEIPRLYEKELPVQKKLFDEEYSRLTAKRDTLGADLKKKDQERIAQIEKIKKDNTKLDAVEEKLKVRVEKLTQSIDTYNSKIDELNTGFGFISNLFRMRKIQKEKDELITQRDEYIKEIEQIRERWVEHYNKLTGEDENIREQWNRLQTELSLTEEKLANLDSNREELVRKAAFLSVLNGLRGHEEYLSEPGKNEAPKKCRRCGSENSKNRFFCHYCGERFSDDRKDIQGSLVEVGELNEVFDSLQSGIRETVSLIALMKGIIDGLGQFTGSVKDVKKSQDTYSALPKLKISVPEKSKELAAQIKGLDERIRLDFKNLHPGEFSSSLKEITDSSFSNKKIEIFFNSMGDELNVRTKEQW